MPDLNKYLAQQEAIRLADAALLKAAGSIVNSMDSRPPCLVTSFAKRSDVPSGTHLMKMSARVVAALSTMGLHEPVSLKLLPGLWWVAQADISTDNPNFEAGGGTTKVITTTETLAHHYSSAYCEVTHGPFSTRAEADGV